ncbi:MAG: hypothetical protein QUS14_00680 [Pyrinomonadaceae bacterium]|nr:hypothetical protein [Pyrinomonadaceae bacterium]
MNSSGAYKLAPAVTDDKRVDVSIEDGEAVVRLSDWVEGLGWSTQKTMRLNEEMLDDLHRMLSAARLRMKRANIEIGVDAVSSKVLEFPQIG